MPCSSVSASSSGTGLLQIQQSRSPKNRPHIIHLFLEEALVCLAGPTVLPDNGCGYISTGKYLVSTVIHSPLDHSRHTRPQPMKESQARQSKEAAENGPSAANRLSGAPPLVARSCYWGPLLGHSNLSPLSYRLSAKRRCDCNRLLSKASLTGVGPLPSGEAMGIWGFSGCSSRGEVRQADRTGLNPTAISGLLIQVVHSLWSIVVGNLDTQYGGIVFQP